VINYKNETDFSEATRENLPKKWMNSCAPIKHQAKRKNLFPLRQVHIITEGLEQQKPIHEIKIRDKKPQLNNAFPESNNLNKSK